MVGGNGTRRGCLTARGRGGTGGPGAPGVGGSAALTGKGFLLSLLPDVVNRRSDYKSPDGCERDDDTANVVY